ncbi:membrane protein [methanotrophic bacterial endosymbiont of Bathymodiolus sp.]|nr:membrane protein [methanotrophic bacterial endosymbiont of Bathymodiolus sp.]
MNFNFSTCITSLTVFLNKPKPNRYEWLFITSLSVVLTLFLYPSALNGYWRFDDGAHLMFATEYSPSQYFFNPVVTRAFSGANITPWNVFFMI